MSTLTSRARRTWFPSLATDPFDTGRFMMPSIFDFDGDLLDWNGSARIPSVNITETNKDFRIEVAAPGLERKDFKVEVENDILSISAEKKEEKKEDTENYRRREFSYNSFSRSFRLPENCVPDKIDAKYDGGILRLMLPKKEITVTKSPKEIRVHD